MPPIYLCIYQSFILMTDTSINTEITRTFDTLIRTFSAFDAEQINTVPFAGSWTAGQVAEHILKSGQGFPEFLQAETETGARPLDEKIPGIRSLFLNMELKMQSPDFNRPSVGPHNQKELSDAFRRIKAELEQAAGTLDLSLTCKSFAMPGFGYLTRLEWLAFVCTHTQRHTIQLKNIYNVLNP